MLRNGGVAALVGEANTGQEAVQMCRDRKWDVVILDVALRHGIGVETLTALRRDDPDLPVVMHGRHSNPLLARRCLELGAVGYALKSGDPLELICAIEAALNNRIHISDNISQLLTLMI